ncbi:MAG TPA: PepSY domain-containing protein [Allosphingosinicella sp.]|jgi:uncharacterized iron-regulated membrane protein
MSLAIFFRRIHKWLGLVIGLQLLLWTISGTAMALIDHEQVSGGHKPPSSEPPPLPASGAAWPRIVETLGAVPIETVALRPLLDRQVYEIGTAGSVLLFDAATGNPLQVSAAVARQVAEAGYQGEGRVKGVTRLKELSLAVRTHELPIWRVDFDDRQASSFYVSGATGKLLERRNDSWRLWDFFWMLHNMDYANRTSFNHPLIVIVGLGAAWLAITGVYLLFKSSWKAERRWFRRRRALPGRLN